MFCQTKADFNFYRYIVALKMSHMPFITHLII